MRYFLAVNSSGFSFANDSTSKLTQEHLETFCAVQNVVRQAGSLIPRMVGYFIHFHFPQSSEALVRVLLQTLTSQKSEKSMKAN